MRAATSYQPSAHALAPPVRPVVCHVGNGQPRFSAGGAAVASAQNAPPVARAMATPRPASVGLPRNIANVVQHNGMPAKVATKAAFGATALKTAPPPPNPKPIKRNSAAAPLPNPKAAAREPASSARSVIDQTVGRKVVRFEAGPRPRQVPEMDVPLLNDLRHAIRDGKALPALLVNKGLRQCMAVNALHQIWADKPAERLGTALTNVLERPRKNYPAGSLPVQLIQAFCEAILKS